MFLEASTNPTRGAEVVKSSTQWSGFWLRVSGWSLRDLMGSLMLTLSHQRSPMRVIALPRNEQW
jgi:hypothetical protein